MGVSFNQMVPRDERWFSAHPEVLQERDVPPFCVVHSPLAPYGFYRRSQDAVIRAVEGVAKAFDCVKSLIHRIMEVVTWLFRALAACFGCPRKSGVPFPRDVSPPSFAAVDVDNGTACFDLKYYFAINEGRLWFKPIAVGPEGEWRLFGELHGLPSSDCTQVTHVYADAGTLIVLDDKGRVHTGTTEDLKWDFEGKNGWQVTSWNTDWRTEWFHMPIVSFFLNKKKDPVLFPFKNNGFKAIAMSYKGKEAGYYIDCSGKPHPDPFIGVRSLYGLSSDGTRIFFADPWLSNHFNNEVTGPEEGRFVAENLAASGSTIFLIQRAREASGKEINKMYTRYADFDSIGSDPFLPSTSNPKNRLPLVRLLPSEDWMEQPPIKLEGKASLTQTICVVQTGSGQYNRQLRVVGANSEGIPGYYFKQIYDLDWRFQPTPYSRIKEGELLAAHQSHIGFKQGPQVTEDYVGALSCERVGRKYTIEIKKFSRQGLNERGLHTVVEIGLSNGKALRFPLFAYLGLPHLLGKKPSNQPYWRLIAPQEYYFNKEYRDDPEARQILRALFLNFSAIDVNVKEGERSVQMTPSYTLCNRFTMKATLNESS